MVEVQGGNRFFWISARYAKPGVMFPRAVHGRLIPALVLPLEPEP